MTPPEFIIRKVSCYHSLAHPPGPHPSGEYTAGMGEQKIKERDFDRALHGQSPSL